MKLLKLALLAFYFLVISQIVLLLLPVRVQFIVNKTTADITIDNQTKTLLLTKPISKLRLPAPEKNEREYQIDGSDTTNNFTYDKNYFEIFSSSFYYRLQALLRQEATYSQWRNLQIENTAKKTIFEQKLPSNDKEVSLPETFSASIDLFRIEIPRTIELTDTDGKIIAITLDRNDKYVLITQRDPGQLSQQLDKDYFPIDSRPFFAELISMGCMVISVTFLLFFLLTLIARFLPKKFPPLNPNLLFNRKLVFLSLAYLFFMSLYISGIIFDKSPNILDSIAYYTQAKVFATGAWTAPLPQVKDAFPTVFFVHHNQQWFSLFPPGTSLLLVPGFLIGMPWIIEPVLAVLTAFMIYLIGKRQYNREVSLLALLLLITSPFFQLQAGSFLSHVPALFFASCFYYIMLCFAQKPQRRLLFLAAVVLGCTFLIREITAVLYGVTIGVYYLLHSNKHSKLSFVKDLLPACLILFGFLLFYLVMYNGALTGSPLVLPRHLGDTRDHYGFGQGVGFYGQHTLGSGLVNTDELLTLLNIHLFGWPFYFAFVLIVIPFFTKHKNSADYLNASLIAIHVLINIGYYYHSIALGPRHYFEAFPAFVLLASRGFFVLKDIVAHNLVQIGQTNAVIRASYTTLFLGILLLLCNLLYFTPRQLSLYKNFTGLSEKPVLITDTFFKRNLQGKYVNLPNAVVMTDNWRIYNAYFSYLNCPKLDCQTIFAYIGSDKTRKALFEQYPNRMFYEVKRKNDVFNLYREK